MCLLLVRVPVLSEYSTIVFVQGEGCERKGRMHKDGSNLLPVNEYMQEVGRAFIHMQIA